MEEKNAYILGTDTEELQRLGLQHQVWSSEAQTGWNLAKFSQGMKLLDLGCGPGFCAQELAYITGSTGKVFGIDKSKAYIDYTQELIKMHDLSMETQLADFNEMTLATQSLDGVYCRWAMAWIPNVKEILSKIKEALKPGGRAVFHEYYDWSTHQTYPERPTLKKAIRGALKSFEDSAGEINIGRALPEICAQLGMKVESIRPMTKLARPQDLAWHWPKSFYKVYFPKVADMGYIRHEEAEMAYEEMTSLEVLPEATLFCPFMVEVIVQKI